MNNPYTLRMLDPWSLMYGEYEEQFIEVLRQRIGPKHPLYNREVYAIAIRRDPEATLFHAFNDGFFAVVYFSAHLIRTNYMIFTCTPRNPFVKSVH
jgi:hypothetical protein